MATDLTVRTCASCAHAAICPNRETFMSFYRHRNETMVKCGDGSGHLDTTNEITVRVEHRYLDGPALEELYKELGLGTSFGCNPCMQSYFGCPLNGWKHPYDTPIYAPYPHAAGYIAPLCQGARTPNGDRIQFVAPMLPPNTNQVHASPYPPFPKYTTCGECPSFNPDKKIDYAKLGGTIYSTFGVSEIQAEEGSIIHLADIPTPKEIRGGYYRSDKNPVSFVAESEEDTFIIYYTYEGSQAEIPQNDPNAMTEQELIDAGKMHILEIFHGSESYFIDHGYLTNINFDQSVFCDGIVAEIPRKDEEGNTIIFHNDRMCLNSSEDDEGCMTPLIEKHDAGKFFTQYLDGNFARIKAAEGDAIILLVEFHQACRIDLDALKQQIEPYADISFVYMGAVHQNRYAVRIEIRIKDSDIHMALPFIYCGVIDTTYNDSIIDYDPWDTSLLMLGTKSARMITHGGKVVDAEKPCYLRYLNDPNLETSPSYEAMAPNENIVTRLYATLIGYTEEGEKRKTFDSTMGDLIPNTSVEAPQAIGFGETEPIEEGVKKYWGMWGLVPEEMEAVIGVKLDKLYGDNIESTLVKVDEKGLNLATLDEVYPIMTKKYDLIYQPNMIPKLVDEITAKLDEAGMKAACYLIPDDAKEVLLQNRYPDSEEDLNAIPEGTVKLNSEEEDTTHDLSEYLVTKDITVEDALKQYHLLLIAQPKSIVGFAYNEQNFIGYEIQISTFQKEISLTAIFDGKDMNPLQSYPSLKNMTGYELHGVVSEDVDKVIIDIKEGNVVELTGDKALFYRLSNTMDVKFQEIITCKVYRPGYESTNPEVSTFAIPFRFATDITFSSTQLCSIKDIVVEGHPLYSIEEVEVAGVTKHEEKFYIIDVSSFHATCQRKDDSIVISLSNVGTNLSISIDYQEGSEGVSTVCERCADYVDTAPYKFMEWVPLCKDFVAGSENL